MASKKTQLEPTFYTNIQKHVDGMMSVSNRWVLLLASMIMFYGFLVFVAFRQSASDHRAGEIDFLIYPEKGGYNEVRGDVSTPQLWNWEWREVVMFVGIAIILACLFNHFNKPHKSLFYVLVKWIVIGMHVALLCFLLPVNKFHQRLFYNFRSVAVSVFSNIESFVVVMIAILLIILPNGGDKTYTKHILGLIVEVGLIQLAIYIFLGTPHYAIEPYTEDRLVPNQYYSLITNICMGMFVFAVFLVWLYVY